MSGPAFSVAVGDTARSLSVTLLKADGYSVDLTLASSVTFFMRPVEDTENTVESPAVIVDPAGGVRYDFSPEDVATPGLYQFSFQVEFPEGFYTYPTDGPLLLEVVSGLANEPPDPGPFVSAIDVFQVTCEVVEDRHIALATSLIAELVGNDLSDVTVFTDPDLVQLKRAISWQSAFLTAHPDVLKRISVTSVSQLGDNLALTSPDALIYSPLALKALRRCSWMIGRDARSGFSTGTLYALPPVYYNQETDYLYTTTDDVAPPYFPDRALPIPYDRLWPIQSRRL